MLPYRQTALILPTELRAAGHWFASAGNPARRLLSSTPAFFLFLLLTFVLFLPKLQTPTQAFFSNAVPDTRLMRVFVDRSAADLLNLLLTSDQLWNIPAEVALYRESPCDPGNFHGGHVTFHKIPQCYMTPFFLPKSKIFFS